MPGDLGLHLASPVPSRVLCWPQRALKGREGHGKIRVQDGTDLGVNPAYFSTVVWPRAPPSLSGNYLIICDCLF